MENEKTIAPSRDAEHATIVGDLLRVMATVLATAQPLSLPTRTMRDPPAYTKARAFGQMVLDALTDLLHAVEDYERACENSPKDIPTLGKLRATVCYAWKELNKLDQSFNFEDFRKRPGASELYEQWFPYWSALGNLWVYIAEFLMLKPESLLAFTRLDPATRSQLLDWKLDQRKIPKSPEAEALQLQARGDAANPSGERTRKTLIDSAFALLTIAFRIGGLIKSPGKK